jgi:multiple sugar transport system ATP-binding protein
MAEVTLKNIQKFYGDVRAVDGVNLDIRDKEFVTLVGPSGCGKTTTLHMVAGLIELDGGEIWIGNRNVSELDPKDRDIAMVFQNYALYPHKTVRDNLEFPLRMRRVEKQMRDQRIERAARVLSIEPLLKRKPKELSGGQQQRVALGRAIVRNPAVFLMDEPLSNLDAKLRVQMRTEIKHLQEELQATMVYVTHDQMEAMTMSDRIAIMDRGKVQQYGTPYEVYNKPANLFVAGFIGSPPMNLVPARLLGAPGSYQLQLDETTLTPRTERVQRLLRKTSSPELMLGIRHGAISMAPSGAPNSVATQVYTVEPTGDVTYVQAKIGGKLCTLSTNDIGFRASIGEPLHLVLNEDRLYFFEAVSGAALND